MQAAFEHLVAVLRQEAFIIGLEDLPTNYVLVPATIYLARQGGQFPTDAIRRRFIRWILLAGLWARYSGASETKLQQDVALVTGRDLDPTHELEAAILRERGRVTLQEGDLDRARIDSAVARLSRVVARHREARDWFTGVRIHDPLTGKSLGDERHRIFSRRVLKQLGFSDSTRINAVANRVVLGQPAPKEHRSASPSDYLPEIEQNQPGALQAQSVPMDRALWQPERFLDFLATRRSLLAAAMNEFIAGWLPDAPDDSEQNVRALIAAGENETLEFKSSLRWDRREERVNKVLEQMVVKTLAGFLNALGGTLLIGIDDDEAIVGLAADYATLTHLYHPSHNLVSHHAVMMDRTGEWHYKCAFEDRLHERLAGPSRSRFDAQGIVDRLLGRFGASAAANPDQTHRPRLNFTPRRLPPRSAMTPFPGRLRAGMLRYSWGNAHRVVFPGLLGAALAGDRARGAARVCLETFQNGDSVNGCV